MKNRMWRPSSCITGSKVSTSGGREKAGPPRHFEKPEGEETVDAFGIAGDHEGPFGIPRQLICRFGLKRDVIGRTICESTSHGGAPRSGRAQGLRKEDREESPKAPHRMAALTSVWTAMSQIGREMKARKSVGFELRPINHGGPIGIVRCEQGAAEQRLCSSLPSLMGPGAGSTSALSEISGKTNASIVILDSYTKSAKSQGARRTRPPPQRHCDR